jgi:DNA-binding NarL/FixJ family response regulator
MVARLRILVADDHPDIISSLERRLRIHGYVVLKSVRVLSKLSVEVRRQRPDIVILDISFGKESSLPQLPRLVRACPATRYVIYSGADAPELMRDAFANGASGYVLKLYSEELVGAIESVASGHRYIATEMQVALASAAGLAPVLNLEQERLYALLHAGMKQSAIAVALDVSLRTCERRVTLLARFLRLDRRGHHHIVWKEVRVDGKPVVGDAVDRQESPPT